jgi:hypothetical protein
MPEQTPTDATDTKSAEQTTDTAKPEKGQRKPAASPAPEPPAFERRRARPEDAMVVSALLDLHRTVEAKAESTIRGRSPSVGNRYLEAARTLGDELVTAILGPNAKV